MKVGILTGGGDCPGLNAVIRAVVRRAGAHRLDIVGIRDGWKGLLEPVGRTQPLTPDSVSDILARGGTLSLISRRLRVNGSTARALAAQYRQEAAS